MRPVGTEIKNVTPKRAVELNLMGQPLEDVSDVEDFMRVAQFAPKRFSVKIPRIGVLASESLSDLVQQVGEARDNGGYGASDIGSRWAVKFSGKQFCYMSYNGRLWDGKGADAAEIALPASRELTAHK
jgi:hypothetical protein